MLRAPLTPMLVTPGPIPRAQHRYAFEVKWDGFRALVGLDQTGVQVWSRNGHDMTTRYPELQELGERQGRTVLDGEIVVLDASGKPDFAGLWFRGRGGSACRVVFMLFDVLELDGRPLIDTPYRDRRQILEDLDLQGTCWCVPHIEIGAGDALFAATREMGLEGIVAKRLDSRYKPGARSRAWVKTKHFQTRNFALLGWLPPEEWRQDRGCVVLGLQTERGIAVAGTVESGYGRALVEQLPRMTRAELRALQRPDRVWEGDAVIAAVKYLEWSSAGGLRHASIVETLP